MRLFISCALPPLALNAFFAQFLHLNTVSFPLYLRLLFLLPVAVTCASVRLSPSVYTRTSFSLRLVAEPICLSLFCFSSYAPPPVPLFVCFRFVPSCPAQKKKLFHVNRLHCKGRRGGHTNLIQKSSRSCLPSASAAAHIALIHTLFTTQIKCNEWLLTAKRFSLDVKTCKRKPATSNCPHSCTL